MFSSEKHTRSRIHLWTLAKETLSFANILSYGLNFWKTAFNEAYEL